MTNDEIQDLPVSDLELDSENPRLPEGLLKKPEQELLKYFYEEGVLEELAHSMLDNGFFRSEPLLVIRKNAGRKKKGIASYTVLEGNRRLSTLRFLLRDRVPEDLRLVVGRESTGAQLARLKSVSCQIVESREDVDAIIGFRHIGGLKKWESEAKARYILRHIDQLASDRICDDPFYELGRRVGSNAQGIRNPYIAIAILHVARNEYGITQVNELLGERRFSVWQRALSSGEIRDYIGFGKNATTYKQVRMQLKKLNPKQLKEVISDFVRGRRARAIVGDSREITEYGRVLQNPVARAILRQSQDLDLAKQLVDKQDLPIRVRKLVDLAKVLKDEVDELETIDEETRSAVVELFKVARAMKSVAENI